MWFYYLTAWENRFWLLIGKALALAYQEEGGNWDLGVDFSKYFCLIIDSAFLPQRQLNHVGEDHVKTCILL